VNRANAESETESIKQKLEKIADEKEAAAEQEDYDTAARLQYQELQLEKQLEAAADDKQVMDVDIADIQLIVEEKTGIPVTKLQSEEQAQMRDLGTNLSSKVIGQQEAVEKIAKAVRRSRAGLKSKYRPIGSFLFVGPTGVGKTELTKALAEELFGSRDSMIRLDM